MNLLSILKMTKSLLKIKKKLSIEKPNKKIFENN